MWCTIKAGRKLFLGYKNDKVQNCGRTADNYISIVGESLNSYAFVVEVKLWNDFLPECLYTSKIHSEVQDTDIKNEAETFSTSGRMVYK